MKFLCLILLFSLFSCSRTIVSYGILKAKLSTNNVEIFIPELNKTIYPNQTFKVSEDWYLDNDLPFYNFFDDISNDYETALLNGGKYVKVFVKNPTDTLHGILNLMRVAQLKGEEDYFVHNLSIDSETIKNAQNGNIAYRGVVRKSDFIEGDPYAWALWLSNKPFHFKQFDDRNWLLGHRGEDDSQVIQEYILDGEKIENWSELITYQFFKSSKLSKSQLVANAEKIHKTQCTDLFWNIVKQNVKYIIYEWSHNGCNGYPAQHELVKVSEKKEGLLVERYTSKDPKNFSLKKWLEIFKKENVTLIKGS